MFLLHLIAAALFGLLPHPGFSFGSSHVSTVASASTQTQPVAPADNFGELPQ